MFEIATGQNNDTKNKKYIYTTCFKIRSASKGIIAL